MKLSKYYRKEHVGEDCYVLYNTLHMKPIIAKQDGVVTLGDIRFR